VPVLTLSAEVVKALPVPPTGKQNYTDTNVTGFLCEIRASGGITYYLKFRTKHGRLKQYKIGDGKSLPFEKAKTAAQKLRARVVLGEDICEERQNIRAIPLLKDFVEDHFIPHIKGYRRNYGSDLSYIRIHLLPRYGSLHLDQLNQNTVTEGLHDMRAKEYAPAMANRLPIIISTIYTLAKKMKIPGAEVNPAKGVQLYDPANARERFLSIPETRRLHDAIQTSPNPQLKYIVALLLLTGARKRELLDAKFSDIDVERRTWRVPLSKSGRTRYIPLSAAALSVLAQVPRFDGCPYVLPNVDTKKPFHSVFFSWNTARKKAGLPDVRLHDLRHSFASNLINAGHDIFLVGRALGHRLVKSTARYSHLSQTTLLAAVDDAANATGTNWNAPEPKAA
jgi:integrase